MSDFNSTRTVTARKEHKCAESHCRRKILPGDKYVRIASVWDGDFFSLKSCVRCERLRRKARKRYGDYFRDGDGIIYGELLNSIREARGS